MNRPSVSRWRLYLAAWREVLARHGATLRHAWALRRQIDGLPFRRDEAEFHASALALQRSPPSPVPRVAAWLLIGFAAIALLWAVCGKVDIVAVAPGKIVPSGRSKPIQAIETASVAAIHVQDGDAVRAGELLLQLDATAAAADIDRITNELTVVRLQSLRARALLDAMSSGQRPVLPAAADLPPDRRQEAIRQVDAQFAEHQSALARLAADIERRRAELQSTQALLRKLEQTLPIVRGRAQDYLDLQQRQFVSRHAWLEKEQARLELENEANAQRSRLDEIRAALRESESQRSALVAETRRQLVDAAADGEQKAESLRQELVKAQLRRRLMDITAPIDGTVQQLAVNTVGAVVTPAQALMLLVPGQQPVEVEALLENKDVGFVKFGQPVEVKIETFPYTRYGTLPGIVAQVSPDAVSDDTHGLAYQAKIRLDRASLEIDGTHVPLQPGMAVVAEVKTGRRRVIEYFLSPLMAHTSESLRER